MAPLKALKTIPHWKAYLAVGLAGLVIALVGLGLVVFGPQKRPNVIIVLWDCVRADHVSHLGYGRQTTPTLDRLAKGGLSLARATAQAPWTLPSVTSLLTGLPPWRSGAGLSRPTGRNLDVQADQIKLPGPDKPLLLDWLAANGYRTGVVSGNIYIGRQFFKGHRVDDLLTPKGDAKAMTDAALKVLNQNTDRPRALYVHLMDAHFPTWPPQEYREMFKPRAEFTISAKMKGWAFPNPVGGPRQRAALDRYRQGKTCLYDGAIRFMDDQLARLVKWAKAHDAVIIILADHGEELWDHQALEKALYADPRGICGIGHGHTLFQELLHVPLVIWSPRAVTIKNKGLRRAPAGIIDVWPTLAGLLKLAPPRGLPGRNLLKAGSGQRVMLCGGIGYGNAKYAALDWPWKLIVSQDETALLFDLKTDPQEKKNILGENPEIAEELFEQLAPIFKGRPTGSGRSLEIDEDTGQRLKALGYM